MRRVDPFDKIKKIVRCLSEHAFQITAQRDTIIEKFGDLRSALDTSDFDHLASDILEFQEIFSDAVEEVGEYFEYTYPLRDLMTVFRDEITSKFIISVININHNSQMILGSDPEKDMDFFSSVCEDILPAMIGRGEISECVEIFR